MDANMEVWKLIVSALTPAAIAGAGYFINKALSTREHELSMLRSKQEIRKQIYDEIGSKLNQIFCFVCDVGDFGYYEPPHIIHLKRDIDRKFEVYKTLWHKRTLDAYEKFMGSSFDTYSGGPGTPAKICASLNEKQAFFSRVGKQWKSEWNAMFTVPMDKNTLFTLYDNLVEAFVNDITSDRPV